jgi:primosomal protein N' (replication factor Y) (superfamily II helicase)
VMKLQFAEVSVNSPVAQRKTFSYAIPQDLTVGPGQAVWVPFGDKILQGIVLEITASPAVEETKDILGVIEAVPLLSPFQISLANWISRYYLSPLFDAVALMLPPGFERRAVTFFQRNPSISLDQSSSDVGDPELQPLLELVRTKDKVYLSELSRLIGARRAGQLGARLVKRNLILKRFELEPVKVKPRISVYLTLKIEGGKAREIAAGLGKRTGKRAAILEYLANASGEVRMDQARAETGCSPGVIQVLVNEGLIEKRLARVDRDPMSDRNIPISSPLPLTPAQEAAFQSVKSSLSMRRSIGASPDVFLLHGVTASGKTEVYLQAMAEAVRVGKRGIVLVPEISLTPQTIERFAARFPHRVAVLHSNLSLGQQFDEWQRIRNGEFDVVIGPRSAIFAPLPDLGLIVLDEEHEWTYKQQEVSPRYHAREVALKLAELTGARLLLGSATPDVESFQRAAQGTYQLLELPDRAPACAGSPLPTIEIVDMREELKAGNYCVFGRSLFRAISDALDNREQAILFLNRRGGSSFVECRNCGLVIRCRRCDVAMSYHFVEDSLVCHQCNSRAAVPHVCPRCKSSRIKYIGIGTEKLEIETASAFPGARVLRWDSDATRRQGHSHETIWNSFRSGEADILIGTQMVAKGIDLPNVTVVGVVNADIALNLPDFRAGERTFQLLSQVAGRAGRGKRAGKVFIQTYCPDHYAIQASARQDYSVFFAKEIAYRKQLHNPPFSRLARLTFSHTNDDHGRTEAEKMKRVLIAERDARGAYDFSLIGPAPAFTRKLRGRYRWQIVLRSSDPGEFLGRVPLPKGWTVDIDPVGLA